MKGLTTPLGRRYKLVIAVLIIAVSIGIAAVGIPQLPHSTPSAGTLLNPVNAAVNAGNPSAPGFFALQLPGIQAGRNFTLAVEVTNSALSASFCILTDQQFHAWAVTNQTTNFGASFPRSYCRAQAGPTAQAILNFIAPTTGTWDVVVLNTNSVSIGIKFSPVL